jgi:membrane protein implicated in regulation of membrane protease activity
MTPEIATVLKSYFGSIEQSFEDTLASQKIKDWVEKAGILAVITFILSLLPVIPLLLRYFIPWVAKSEAATIRGHQLPLASLWVWWPLCIFVTFLCMLLLMKWELVRDKQRKKNWLSEPQMRFASCYAILDEIEKYHTNGLVKHIDNAVGSWKRLANLLVSMLRPFNFLVPTGIDVERVEFSRASLWDRPGRMHLYAEIDALKDRFLWFRLDPHTEGIIEAFETLPPKIRDRLQDKKDLGEVSSCLLDLSGYLYSKIPDVPAHQGTESLTSLGDVCLESFSERLRRLEAYATETKSEVTPARFRKAVFAMLRSIPVPFSHQSIFVCFVTWYIFVQILTIVALKTTLHFLPNVDIDSAIVATLVGCPLACAVTAVALSRARSRPPSAGKGNESS